MDLSVVIFIAYMPTLSLPLLNVFQYPQSCLLGGKAMNAHSDGSLDGHVHMDVDPPPTVLSTHLPPSFLIYLFMCHGCSYELFSMPSPFHQVPLSSTQGMPSSPPANVGKVVGTCFSSYSIQFSSKYQTYTRFL